MTARSGSIALAECMGATCRLGFPSEYFNVREAVEHHGVSEPIGGEMCKIVRRVAATPNDVVSFKLAPHQLEDISPQVDLTQWFTNPYWIWLRRRDVLAQAISHVIARQTDRWHSESETAAIRHPEYDFWEINGQLNFAADENRKWEVYFSERGIRPLRIDYEDMQGNLTQTVRKIASYAGVRISWFYRAKPKNRIQRTAINSEWHRRYISEHRNS